MRIGIVELYYGESGKKGFYNNQELGIAKAFKMKGYEIIVFYPQNDIDNIIEELVEDRIKIVYVPATTIGNHSKYDWNILKKYNNISEAYRFGGQASFFVKKFSYYHL